MERAYHDRPQPDRGTTALYALIQMSDFRQAGGVAGALERVRQGVYETMRDRMLKARENGRLDLSDEDIESMARLAAQAARRAAADGIAEAFQEGVNRSASVDDFKRITVPPPKMKP